jgi:phage/plasmid-like protein (TIGR03299 family)
MAHELEIKEGEASFAYRKEGGAPWHRLGKAVEGHQTPDEMLRLAKADYQVALLPVLFESDGVIREMKGRYITARINDDGTVVPFETVKDRYHVVQNSTVLDKAINVVGASKGDAIMDTAGVLNDGKQFFATIDLGTLIIDPMGVHDKLSRYLVVSTSHDGTQPITYACTDIRAVCANTVRFGLQTARSVFTARHTANVETALTEANQVLGISDDWAREFKKCAEQMLAISVPPGSNKIDTVLNTVWPIQNIDTDRKRENRDEILTKVRQLYGNPRNAGGYGYNGWTLYNSVVEYFDHHWSDDANKNAIRSMTIGNKSYVSKLKAQDAVLSLV